MDSYRELKEEESRLLVLRRNLETDRIRLEGEKNCCQDNQRMHSIATELNMVYHDLGEVNINIEDISFEEKLLIEALQKELDIVAKEDGQE